VGRLTDFGDTPAFWVPQIAASYGRPGHIGVRASVSGLGPGAGVSTAMGGARIERAMATLGLVWSFRPERVVQPIFGIAAGVDHWAVHGMSSTPGLAADSAAFSAMVGASVGLALAFTPRLAMLLEMEGLMSSRTQTVRIYDEDVATFDRPNLFAHAGLLAAF
jgi:hypothetical protein